MLWDPAGPLGVASDPESKDNEFGEYMPCSTHSAIRIPSLLLAPIFRKYNFQSWSIFYPLICCGSTSLLLGTHVALQSLTFNSVVDKEKWSGRGWGSFVQHIWHNTVYSRYSAQRTVSACIKKHMGFGHYYYIRKTFHIGQTWSDTHCNSRQSYLPILQY